MLSCDYNGWNDTPEDEREALDAYEAGAEKARSLRPIVPRDARSRPRGLSSRLSRPLSRASFSRRRARSSMS